MYNPKLHFHFTGIAGSGMSGIAEVLLSLGFRVTGSDLRPGEVSERLRSLGARIFEGHDSRHVDQSASLLVYSSAVGPDNVELVEARRRGIPVIRRAEVLAELMRLKYGVAVAGSHGKTTTTSMIAAIMEAGGFDPTVIIGGQLKARGTGSRIGRGDFLVAETDESDKSFLLLKPTIAVVTNIDAEHLNAYSSLAELEESFECFVSAVPFYGLAILCADDHRVRSLAARYSGRKLLYGLSPDAELQAREINLAGMSARFEVWRQDELLFPAEIQLPGRHMVVNALAAVAVGLELGLDSSKIVQALLDFSGVSRRSEVVGEVGEVLVINDYGHHPTEIKATLRGLREGWQGKIKRLHVVFQPHRFSRVRDCFVDFLEAFNDADNLIMTDIYPANEAPIDGVTGQRLFEALVHKCKTFVPGLEEIPSLLASQVAPGDIVICLGAGSVGQLSYEIVRQMRDLHA